jgi:hypothetical protein
MGQPDKLDDVGHDGPVGLRRPGRASEILISSLRETFSTLTLPL